MAHDHSDRDQLKRNKRGALSLRTASTGSSMRGGSVTHIGGRKRLNRALKAGKGILVRVSDGVCLRAATFDEVTQWAKHGPIHVPDVIGDDGSFGAICDIRRQASSAALTGTSCKLDKPRLVPKKRKA